MLALLFIIISLILYGLDSNIFKDASGDRHSLTNSLVYYLLHSLLYIVIGIPFLSESVIHIFTNPYFYILMITETMSALGILYVLRGTNATISVAILGISNMSASLLINFSSLLFILINVGCLCIYFYQSRNSLNLRGWFMSVCFIFAPSVFSATLLTSFTEGYGNAMAVFGFATLPPVLLLWLFYHRKIEYKNTRPFVRSAIISGVAGFFCFYAFSIAAFPERLLIALAFEVITTELTAYIFKNQSNLALGSKSKRQLASLVVFCCSTAIATLI